MQTHGTEEARMALGKKAECRKTYETREEAGLVHQGDIYRTNLRKIWGFGSWIVDNKAMGINPKP
jgi:hypothetical protein